MPTEILMTDLEHLKEQERRSHGLGEDIHAAGTPGGGSEYGGLAGTNVGDGSPDNVDLDDIFGPGNHDFETEEELTGYAGLSGTLSGNALACAAGVAALAELRQPGVYLRLHALGERLRRGVERRAAAVGVPLRALGDGPVAQVFFVGPDADLTSERGLRAADGRQATRFGLECLQRGLFVIPNSKLYLSLAHTDADLDWTLDVMEDALRAMR